MKNIDNKRIAILTEEGFEQSELMDPKQKLEEAGAVVTIVSPNDNRKIKAWNHTDWGVTVETNKKPADVNVDDYDALILPGGVMNPDKLRRDHASVDLVKKFMDSGKPVAAICHGPQVLIEADAVKGKTLTSFFSISTDLKNAGATWVDKEVQKDGNLITSRNPDDLPSFVNAIIDALV